MALFELEQDFGSDPETEWKAPTFKECAAADIDLTFFEQDEHADLHTVDEKEALVIVDDQRLKEHNSHWETGAKQNFDTGLCGHSSSGTGADAGNGQVLLRKYQGPGHPLRR